MKKVFIATALALASLSATASEWANVAVFDNGTTVFQFKVSTITVGMGPMPAGSDSAQGLKNRYPQLFNDPMIRVVSRVIDLEPAARGIRPQINIMFVRLADCKAGRGTAGWVSENFGVKEYPFTSLAAGQNNRSWFSHHLCKIANQSK